MAVAKNILSETGPNEMTPDKTLDLHKLILKYRKKNDIHTVPDMVDPLAKEIHTRLQGGGAVVRPHKMRKSVVRSIFKQYKLHRIMTQQD